MSHHLFKVGDLVRCYDGTGVFAYGEVLFVYPDGSCNVSTQWRRADSARNEVTLGKFPEHALVLLCAEADRADVGGEPWRTVTLDAYVRSTAGATVGDWVVRPDGKLMQVTKVKDLDTDNPILMVRAPGRRNSRGIGLDLFRLDGWRHVIDPTDDGDEL